MVIEKPSFLPNTEISWNKIPKIRVRWREMPSIFTSRGKKQTPQERAHQCAQEAQQNLARLRENLKQIRQK